jgi:hypothetical protein
MPHVSPGCDITHLSVNLVRVELRTLNLNRTEEPGWLFATLAKNCPCLTQMLLCAVFVQSQVLNRPDQQVMLEGQIGTVKTIFTFGLQTKLQPGQVPQPHNLMEGTAIFCLPKV